jgi:hypothetical protein
VHVFKVWKLCAMYCVLPKIIQTRLTANTANIINKK